MIVKIVFCIFHIEIVNNKQVKHKSKMKKNTRLLYRDEKNLLLFKQIHKLDRALLGDLFLALMEYDTETKEIPDCLDRDSIVYPIFLDQKDKIDTNEEKWRNDKRRITSAENGRKAAEKQKQINDCEREFTAMGFDKILQSGSSEFDKEEYEYLLGKYGSETLSAVMKKINNKE